MSIARVENDAIAEERAITMEDVPPHKRALWRPLVIEGDGPIVTISIEPDRVRKIRSERPLAEIKAEYSASVDADAERERLKYITPGYGQALTYQEKFAQAQAVIAMGRVAADALSEADRRAQFPTLAASVGVEAQTLADVADLVVSRYAQFAQLSYSIERARLSGKAAIQAASTADQVKSAYQAIIWTQL